MPTFKLFATTLLAALLLFSGATALAQAGPQTPASEDARMLPYAEPGQLVDIGGRHINLQCAGSGGPTIILMAGIFSWSVVWYKTQPLIAQRTRVCAFDRASYGFSDPAPRPQILSEVVDDLHAALQAGAIPGPYVLVGHSLGGLEARIYAQRWPEDVAGMVLVDPAAAGELRLEMNFPGFDEAEGVETETAELLHCALLARRGPLEPSMPAYADCTSVGALPADTPAAFRSIWPRFFTADYFADKVSLMSSLYTHRYDSADHLRLGAMPLIVLTAKNTWGDTPADIQFSRAFERFWLARHEALAHLSSRGIHRFITGSGHQIQLQRPQAVIDAVNDVLAQLHASAH